MPAKTVVAWIPWVFILMSVAVLIAGLIYAVVVISPAPGDDRRRVTAPGHLPEPSAPADESSRTPSRVPADPPSTRPSDPPAGSNRVPSTAAPSRTPSAAQATKAPAVRARQGWLVASYRRDGGSGAGYRGLLTVRNGTGDAQDWTVALVFDSSSLSISTSGAPLSVRQSGGEVVLSGAAPLRPGASIVVAFVVGDDADSALPSSCVINGGRCVIE